MTKKKRTRGKYRNVKVKHDGITFDSKGEFGRYQELVLLQRAGEISGLAVHPSFELLPSFTDFKGKRVRKVTYKADFSYMEDSVEVVEDFKGVLTQVFRIKQKLFKNKYPHIDFRIVTRNG